MCQTHARTHKHEDAFIRMISANPDLNSCHYFKLDLTNISYKFTVICTGTAKKNNFSLFMNTNTRTQTRALARTNANKCHMFSHINLSLMQIVMILFEIYESYVRCDSTLLVECTSVFFFFSCLCVRSFVHSFVWPTYE